MYLCSCIHSCSLFLYTLRTLTLYVFPMVKDDHKSNYSHVIHNLHDSLGFIPCIMMFLLLLCDIHFLYLSLFLYYTGTLPEVWSTLTSLQNLHLQDNKLTGKSDSCDGYLPSLTSCNLNIQNVILPHFMHILCMTQTHICIHNNMISFIMRCTCALAFILVLFFFIYYILSHSMCPFG